MKSLKVELGAHSYPIYIGQEILPKLGELAELYGFGASLAVITDMNVERLHGKAIVNTLTRGDNRPDLFAIKPGELSKSLTSCEVLLTDLLAKCYGRDLTIFAFGGGVVGDLAGFVASIYKRGVRLVHVPTTLLAQVDSSIGGKTGINHALGKNLIGTFHQPKLIWTDISLLQTLPPREIACGFGEILKYGIMSDLELFETIEAQIEAIMRLEAAVLTDMVLRCCEIKAEIVAADERENGMRMILNLGHTIGHALEAAAGYDKLSHGEAVMAGILAESKIAEMTGLLPEQDLARIEQLILKFNLADKLAGIKPEALLHFIKSDKKSREGRALFIVPQKIGDVSIVDDVADDTIKSAIDYSLLRFS